MSEQNYALTKQLPTTNYDDAVVAVTAALKEEGFGVLTEIDVKKTFKAKLDVDFRRYIILGACNPKLAHRSISAEPNIGLLLPCNVIVSEEGDGAMVGIINPHEMFRIVDNADMNPIVEDVNTKLRRVLDKL